MPTPKGSGSFRFEVAFSFAGPHRDKVRAIAELVAAKLGRDRVFYDDWYEPEILGPNMRVLLQSFYYEQSLMVVADLSNEYAGRPWCQAEAEAIDALRMTIDSARDETARLRLLNAKFGEGRVPGVLPNAGYLDATTKTIEECVELILTRHALLVQRMAEQPARVPLGSVTTATPPPTSPSLSPPPILFFHPATNDDRYSRREKELQWLDNCARDTGIRIATVTGVGGLGKTSLVGHWIQKHEGWRHRAFRGVFFYSFYSNRDPTAFLEAFLQFVCEVEKVRELPKDTPLYHLAANACKRWSYLVVLDGLEVLQHGEENPHYGWIADGELTEFVAQVGAEGTSLLVLTSRFPFPRITDEHPAAARALELALFTHAEGADLLTVCGLTDPHHKLESYSELLGGHPLALRIFAGACMEQPFDDPEKVSRDVRSTQGVEAMPDPDEPGRSPEEKQKRVHRRQFYKLLRWLQRKLSPPKRRLLQLVALFRDPVRTETLIALARGLDAMKLDFADCNTALITGLLDQLSGQFLLQKEASLVDDTLRWTAHPIVRDVFRDAALAAGDTVAKQFADIVAGKTAGIRPKTVTEIRPIVEAIEVLLAAGDFRAADEIFRGRLEKGLPFKSIPAPEEGLRCASWFFESPKRRDELVSQLGPDRLLYYMNEAAMFAANTGELRNLNDTYLGGSEQSGHGLELTQRAVGYRVFIVVETFRGDLRRAQQSAIHALDCVAQHAFREAPLRERDFRRLAHVRLANTLSLMGNLSEASKHFTEANGSVRSDFRVQDGLVGISGVQWAHHRFRLGEFQATRSLVESNVECCREFAWQGKLAVCELLQGELDFQAGSLNAALRSISNAVRVFRNAHQCVDLTDALRAMARVQRAVELARTDARPFSNQLRISQLPHVVTASAETALLLCEESLRLAARCGFLLKKCDALNFRSLLRRESGELDGALADAKEAHAIATRCEYYWGLHEALRQLRDTTQALNRTAEFREWDQAERDLTAKMQPEIEEALRINREHDAEMERLYGKKPGV